MVVKTINIIFPIARILHATTHKTSYICRSLSLRQSFYHRWACNMLSMNMAVAMHQPSPRWPYRGSCHNTSRATRAEY